MNIDSKPYQKGGLPAAQFGSVLRIRMMPNAEAVGKYDKLPEEERRQIRLMHAETDVVLVVQATWTTPLTTADQWPVATFDFHELARMPLLEFKARAASCFIDAGLMDFTASFEDLVAGGKQ